MREYDIEFIEGGQMSDDPQVRRSSRDAPERMAKLVSVVSGRRILDVGCSSGNLTLRYGRAFKNTDLILGVDIDSDLIATANQYLAKESAEVKERVRFVNQPMEDLREAEASFDTLTATEVFEHLLFSQQRPLLEGALRFLKKEGRLFFSVPNRFPGRAYEVAKRYRWDWFNHYTHWTAASLKDHLLGYFNEVVLHPVYDEPAEEGVFLIAEAKGRK